MLSTFLYFQTWIEYTGFKVYQVISSWYKLGKSQKDIPKTAPIPYRTNLTALKAKIPNSKYKKNLNKKYFNSYGHKGNNTKATTAKTIPTVVYLELSFESNLKEANLTPGPYVVFYICWGHFNEGWFSSLW